MTEDASVCKGARATDAEIHGGGAMSKIEVADGNAEMARLWDGPDGDHWTDHADRYNRSTTAYRATLTEAAAVGSTDRVLDIGCGSGATTLEFARAAGQGEALGVDLSSRQLQLGRERAAEQGITNVTFEQADAQVHPFEPGSCDIATSQFGVMFFADPLAAFTNIANAVAPGGRLAMLAWQSFDDNEWLRELHAALRAGRDMATPPPGAPGPFSLAVVDTVVPLLENAGFRDVDVQPVTHSVEFGDDADDTLAFVKTLGLTQGMLAEADEATRARAYENLDALVASHDSGAGVRFDSAAWLYMARR
jgi:ubiquinone/menaquinone biosynthesis C-methylase UbiE